MSINNKDILLDFDEDIVLPFTNEWKKTYRFVQFLIKTNICVLGCPEA